MPETVQQSRQVTDLLKVLRDLREVALLASITADDVEKARQEGKQQAYENVIDLLAPRE